MTKDQLKEVKLDQSYWEATLHKCGSWSDVMGMVDYESGALLAAQIIGLMEKPPRWMHGPLILHGVELLNAQLPQIADHKNVVQGIKDRNQVLTDWATNPNHPHVYVVEATFMGEYPAQVNSLIAASRSLCWSTSHPNKILHFTHEITWVQAKAAAIHEFASCADQVERECASVLRKHIPDLTPYVATARLIK